MESPAPKGIKVLLPFYREAKSFQAVLPCVNSLAVLKRNKRTVDVLYFVIIRNLHDATPPPNEIYPERITDSLAKGKHNRYTILVREIVKAIRHIYFSQTRTFLSLILKEGSFLCQAALLRDTLF